MKNNLERPKTEQEQAPTPSQDTIADSIPMITAITSVIRPSDNKIFKKGEVLEGFTDKEINSLIKIKAAKYA